MSSPAHPRPRLATVTPTCVALSSRPGFASRSESGARGRRCPARPVAFRRERRTDTSATSAAAKNPFSSDDGDQKNQIEATLRWSTVQCEQCSLRSAALFQPTAQGDQSEHSRFGCLPFSARFTGSRGVRCRRLRAKLPRRFRPRPPLRATRSACRTSRRHRGRTRFFCRDSSTAQDRMWQMDALRRLAAGELAEVVGKAALESDEEARRTAARRGSRTKQEQTMPAADRAVLAAYARGVNYYLETHRGQSAAGVHAAELRSASVARARFDSRRACRCIATLTTSWRDEIQKLHMLEKGDRRESRFSVSRAYRRRIRSRDRTRGRFRASTPPRGKPILANDPHLDFAIPSTWYMVHLQRAGPECDRRFAAGRSGGDHRP